MVLLFTLIWDVFAIWGLLFSLVLGLFYAWLFYRKKQFSSRSVKCVLMGLRALSVAIISFLIFAPLIKTITRHTQKPLVLIAQDNSSSIPLYADKGFQAHSWLNQLRQVQASLGKDYDVRLFHFDSKLMDSLSDKFDGKQTDISDALRQLNDRYVNQNIGAVILASDGLYNIGSSPEYEAAKLKAPVFTIGLGDTMARKDLVINKVNYNKTAFLGNDFEVEVLLDAYQSQNENIKLTVDEDGRQVNGTNIQITTPGFHKLVRLKLNADKKGMHKFTFRVPNLSGEISTQNNAASVYIEVLDNKRKVLCLYGGPNPDVGSIKQSLELNKELDVTTKMVHDFALKDLINYNLVILYQIPTKGDGRFADLQSRLNKLRIPVWYVLGAQSDLTAFDKEQSLLKVSASRQDIQNVFASFRPDFSLFTLSDSAKIVISNLPPLSAPYAEFKPAANQAVLMSQKIGNVETRYPLLSFSVDDGVRKAILSAEGIWKWKLSEFENFGNTKAVDELLSQTAIYLTANSNQSRFKVYPAKNMFDEGESILFSGELYNEALELVNQPDVKVDIKGKAGKAYSYILSRNANRYQLDAGTLPADEYKFHAETRLGDKHFEAEGQFAVEAIDVETRQSAANHDLLKKLAKQSGGKFLLPSQTDQLTEIIQDNDNIKSVVYADDFYDDLISFKWIIFLIILFFGAEWFLRKQEGEI